MIRPRFEGFMLGRLASMPCLKLDEWDPLYGINSLFTEIKYQIEKHGSIVHGSNANDHVIFPDGAYSTLEHSLLKLTFVCEKTPRIVRIIDHKKRQKISHESDQKPYPVAPSLSSQSPSMAVSSNEIVDTSSADKTIPSTLTTDDMKYIESSNKANELEGDPVSAVNADYSVKSKLWAKGTGYGSDLGGSGRTLVCYSDHLYALQVAEEDINFGREPVQLTELRRSIHEFLSRTAENAIVEEIIVNRHAHPETPSALYDKFIGACFDVHETHKHSLLLCYHGTPENNLENICENGLDPTKRRRQAFGMGEYFGKRADVSFQYCGSFPKDTFKLVVFAVLCAPEGLTYQTDDILVMHENDFQLPLYIVKLKLHQHQYQQYLPAINANTNTNTNTNSSTSTSTSTNTNTNTNNN